LEDHVPYLIQYILDFFRRFLLMNSDALDGVTHQSSWWIWADRHFESLHIVKTATAALQDALVIEAECFGEVTLAYDRLRAEQRAFAHTKRLVQELNANQEHETVLPDEGGCQMRSAKTTLSFEGSNTTLVDDPLLLNLEEEGVEFLDRLQEVKAARTTFQEALAECLSEVVSAQDTLRAEQRAFARAKYYADALNADQDQETILLDVGGCHFRTLRSTLAFEGSMLETLVDGPFCVDLDEKGAIFIDRDPEPFPLVLAFLRKSEDPWVPIRLERRSKLRALAREARFYGLWTLAKDALRPGLTRAPLTFTIFDPEEYATGRNGDLLFSNLDRAAIPRSAAVCGQPMVRGRHYFTIWTSTPLFAIGVVSADLPVWHGPEARPYGQPLQGVDEVVTLELDLDDRTISFRTRSTSYGVAFRLREPGPFYAAVYLQGSPNSSDPFSESSDSPSEAAEPFCLILSYDVEKSD